MTHSIRRDGVITIASVSIVAAGFFLVAYLPGRNAAVPVTRNIQAAEQSLREIPVRIAELELLSGRIGRLQNYLESVEPVIPAGADVHSIIGHVAGLASENKLKVTRLEPLPPVAAASYEVLPFRVHLSGSFEGIVRFLNGLERHGRLFAVDELSLNQPTKRHRSPVDVEMKFSTYVRHAEFADISGFDASLER